MASHRAASQRTADGVASCGIQPKAQLSCCILPVTSRCIVRHRAESRRIVSHRAALRCIARQRISSRCIASHHIATRGMAFHLAASLPIGPDRAGTDGIAPRARGRHDVQIAPCGSVGALRYIGRAAAEIHLTREGQAAKRERGDDSEAG
jgi:hypothetical protein